MATIEIVKEAITALKDHTGSSVPAINKWIESEKNVSDNTVFLGRFVFGPRKILYRFFFPRFCTIKKWHQHLRDEERTLERIQSHNLVKYRFTYHLATGGSNLLAVD